MKLFNTLTRRKEEFVPIKGNEVHMYACGPTVYNYIHIGNARPLCVFDVLRRYLEYRGYDVTFVQNFTDIDDKLINRAKEENTTVKELAEKYIGEFWTDAKGLNFKKASIHPKATENIDEILDIIGTLMEKGFAYVAEGDVYFRVPEFQEYGKLSHQPLEDLMAGKRIDVSDQKESPMDFVLWKAAKPGEPSWDSPWGKGRPGWHIECSAMARKYLGREIDIHCGGQDLIFPHHENEIAQSECCNGVPFARYWLHNGYINVDNRKMSKSLGNFFTVREIAEQYGYEPIRYLNISSHYRSPINFSREILDQCRSALERLYHCRDNLQFRLEKAADGPCEEEEDIKKQLEARREEFIRAMDDDLNTADAIAAVFELAKDINVKVTDRASRGLCTFAMELFCELCDVLGLLYQKKEQNLDAEVEALIEKRTLARKQKDFATADAIRDQLRAMGVVLEDTPQGIKWHLEK